MEESDPKDADMQPGQTDTNSNIVVWAEIEENSEQTLQSGSNSNQDEDLLADKGIEYNIGTSRTRNDLNSNLQTTRQPTK